MYVLLVLVQRRAEQSRAIIQEGQRRRTRRLLQARGVLTAVNKQPQETNEKELAVSERPRLPPCQSV
jgi:hypothetical protein